MLAATPAWFSGNLPQISLGTLLVLALVVVKLIHTVIMRTALLVVIALVGLFVYANRLPLKACAQTCECAIASKHITVPTCSSDLRL